MSLISCVAIIRAQEEHSDGQCVCFSESSTRLELTAASYGT